MRIISTCLCLALSISAAAQEEKPSLEILLKDAELGMPWEDFKAAHPDVEVDRDAVTGELTATEHLAIDPLLKLELYTSYGFRDGQLREYILVWGDAPRRVREALPDFLEALLRRHGREFSREVQRMKPTSENPEYAPALYWKTDAAHVVASYAETRSAAGRPIGTLTYAVFPIADPLVEEQLVADELAPERVAELWKDLDKAMPKD